MLAFIFTRVNPCYTVSSFSMSIQHYNSRIEYLQRQLEIEQAADRLIFMTKQLTNAILSPQQQDSHIDYISDLYEDLTSVQQLNEVMLARSNNLVDGIRSGRLRVSSIFSWEKTIASVSEEHQRIRLQFAIELTKNFPAALQLYPTNEADLDHYATHGCVIALRGKDTYVISAKQIGDHLSKQPDIYTIRTKNNYALLPEYSQAQELMAKIRQKGYYAQLVDLLS